MGHRQERRALALVGGSPRGSRPRPSHDEGAPLGRARQRTAVTAVSFLERGARQRPAKTAVVDEQGSCTYAELLGRARRVGSALVGRCGRERPVVVFMDKGVDALVAFFGVLMAGAPYVPVDPGVPPERARALDEVLGGPLVVANATSGARAAELFGVSRVEKLDKLETAPADDDALARAAASLVASDPAYVLFTSGSTGVPKGVAVSHAALVEFVEGFVGTFGIGPDDVLGNQAPLDFDVSVKDVYGALAAGATVVLLPRRLFSAPAELVDALTKARVTVLVWAVAALCLVSGLRGLEHAALPTVRLVMFSGEVMPRAHLLVWRERLPRAAFVNLYGPTEVTCNCLYHRLDPSRGYEEGIPLGVALPGRRVLVVDKDGREVGEPGDVGEIYVGGPGIALGYYGDLARTDEAFVRSPLARALPERVYRTGDLARVGESGELFFAGRVDNQVKHLGHRVELEEIDAAFERQPGVRRCRAAYDAGARRLCAFFEGDADLAELRRGVSRALPAAVVPSVIERVERMPLTANGKVDRGALLARAREAAGAPARRAPGAAGAAAEAATNDTKEAVTREGRGRDAIRPA